METVFTAKNNQSAEKLGFEIMEKSQLNWANKKVLIKPNLTIKASPDSGIITNPAFCKGIIDYLKKHQALEIKIGEGTASAENNDMNKIYKPSGFLDLSLKTNIELINFNNDEIMQIEVPDPLVWKTVNVTKTIFDFDVLVNVPVLKTHHIALATLGIKNLMGVSLPVKKRNQNFHKKLNYLREKAKKQSRQNLTKSEFDQAHQEISEKILDLYKAIKKRIPILTVIDGFYGREGNGFEIGETKDMRIAISGRNTVAVDTISAYLMGFNPKSLYYLTLAQKLKLGPSQVSKIVTKGINLKADRKKFNVLRPHS